jgi:hypothetical protein
MLPPTVSHGRSCSTGAYGAHVSWSSCSLTAASGCPAAQRRPVCSSRPGLHSQDSVTADSSRGHLCSGCCSPAHATGVPTRTDWRSSGWAATPPK